MKVKTSDWPITVVTDLDWSVASWEWAYNPMWATSKFNQALTKCWIIIGYSSSEEEILYQENFITAEFIF